MYFTFCSDTETPVLLGYRDPDPVRIPRPQFMYFNFRFISDLQIERTAVGSPSLHPAEPSSNLPIKLMTNFPKKVFTEEDFEKPLDQVEYT